MRSRSTGRPGRSRSATLQEQPLRGGRPAARAEGEGANFGWSAWSRPAVFAGGVPRNRTVLPTIAYPHGPDAPSPAGTSSGTHVSRAFAGGSFVGRYLFGDYCSGKLYAFRPRPGRRPASRGACFKVPFLTSFGQTRRAGLTSSREKGVSRKGTPTPARCTGSTRGGRRSLTRRSDEFRLPARSTRVRRPTLLLLGK